MQVTIPTPGQARQSTARSRWKRWVTPSIVLASALLHGVLLGLPLPPERLEKTLEPEPEPVSPENLLSVAALPDLPTSEPPAPEPPSPESERSQSASPAAPSAQNPVAPSLDSSVTEPEAAGQDEPTDESLSDEPLSDEAESRDRGGPPSLDEQLGDISFYVPNGKATGSVTPDKYSRWISALSALSPDILLNSPRDVLELPYRLDECLSEAPDLANIGIALDPTGNPIGTPEMLTSTGYDVLDRKALEAVWSYPFPDREVATAYTIQVQVRYEAGRC